jgi:hypothetical protein
MRTSSKVAVGFVAVALVVGFTTGFFGLNYLKKPIWGGLAVLCFVTVFLLSLKEQKQGPPKSN